MPPHQCMGIKANGQLCTAFPSRRANDTHPEHLRLCGIHKNTYRGSVNDAGQTHHVEGRCFHSGIAWEGAPLRRVTRWCGEAAAAGGMLCANHEERRAARAANVRPAPAEVARNIVNGFLAQQNIAPWRDVALLLADADEFPLTIRRRVALSYYRNARVRAIDDLGWRHGPSWRFDLYWHWAANGQQGPAPNLDEPPIQVNFVMPMAVHPAPPPRVGGLAAIARDNQNVHTRVVADQTNESTAKLLAAVVPETQQTEKAMAQVWLTQLNVSYSSFLRVANDVNKWFSTKDCRLVGDNLYRKMLRGLVATISAQKDAECRTELFRRLWEECVESLGMCCEGHLSRLCNVLVGFDESFKPPVAFGEILQSKMAVIAGLDVTEEEKRRQATAFFDEYATPQEERVAWLDAF